MPKSLDFKGFRHLRTKSNPPWSNFRSGFFLFLGVVANCIKSIVCFVRQSFASWVKVCFIGYRLLSVITTLWSRLWLSGFSGIPSGIGFKNFLVPGIILAVHSLEFRASMAMRSLPYWLSLSQSLTKERKTSRRALGLSLRKSEIVLKSGASFPKADGFILHR